MPYTYRGCPYYKNESTTQVMPQEMYEERLRAAKPEKFAWERQVADGVTLADLDEVRIRGATNGDDSVNEGVNGYVNGEVNSLTPSQKNVYDIVHDNPGINTKKIAEILKKSPRTIEKHIALLAKTGLIEHRDSDKTGGYYPVEK